MADMTKVKSTTTTMKSGTGGAFGTKPIKKASSGKKMTTSRRGC